MPTRKTLKRQRRKSKKENEEIRKARGTKEGAEATEGIGNKWEDELLQEFIKTKNGQSDFFDESALG